MAKSSGPEVHQANAPYRRAELHPPKAPFPWARVRLFLALGVLGVVAGASALLISLSRCGRVPLQCGAPSGSMVRVPQRVLVGPEGADTMPLRGPLVVNVWLQGCEDCRPAFDAARALEAQGVWARWPLRNVAYGAADPAWAAEHGVARGLRQDAAGSLLVRPFGVSTFTTLVLDRAGNEVLRDRPDRAGFADRVDAALRVATARATLTE